MKLIDLIPGGWPEKKAESLDVLTNKDISDRAWNRAVASLGPIKNAEIGVNKEIIYGIICEYIFELHADNFGKAVEVIAVSLDKILVVKKCRA